MYKLLKCVELAVKEVSKIFNSFSLAFSLKSGKNNIAISSRYKILEDDKESIANDYIRVGKDFYKSIGNEEQSDADNDGIRDQMSFVYRFLP